MTSILELENHPLANMFPHMPSDAQQSLTLDIEENGVLNKVVILENMILDGRSRCKSCLELGIEPPYREFNEEKEGSPMAYVVSENMQRRHLTKSQRAMIVVKRGLSVPPSGIEMDVSQGALPIREAAKRYGVNHVTLYKAWWIYTRDLDIAEEVFEGRLSVGKAEYILRLGLQKQQQLDWLEQYGHEAHEIVELLPRMTQGEFAVLKTDIEKRGLDKAIVLFEGKILDGRERYQACMELGIAPRYTEFQGTHEEATRYCISMNLIRNHMNESQRAMHLVLSGKVQRGGPVPVKQVAKDNNISSTLLYKALWVHERDPVICEDILQGILSVGVAEQQIRTAV